LNGVAAGSGFQVALLGDFRIAHAGVKMGQPEIDAGIASVTGPWIMREMIGLARTIDLTLSGRLMEADESYRIGLLSKIVDADRLMPEAFALADSLAEKAPVAMRLNKQRFREVTEPGFRDSFEAAMRIHHRSYETGEPARMMGRFLDKSRAKGH
jgi:enoyl-CoA hydratase/carnithine racemase